MSLSFQKGTLDGPGGVRYVDPGKCVSLDNPEEWNRAERFHGGRVV
jgi:hypothetical protein